MSSRSGLLYQPPVAVALLASCNMPTKLALYGTTPIVNRLVEESVPSWDLFDHGCSHGHISVVRKHIAKGFTNLKWGFYRACQYGHRDLVYLMIANGANDWNEGLTRACLGGHHDLIDMMIAKGATSCYHWQCKGHEFVPREE